MNERILLVEDDPELGKQVTGYLNRAGFETTWATRGDRAAQLELGKFHMIILDLMLPGMSGFEVLQALRRQSDLPVLVLSALNDSVSKVRALQIGADDYLTKPFFPEELVERVRARLRRPLLQRAQQIELGPLRLDLAARGAFFEGKDIELTRVEFDILEALARRPGSALSRRWLVEHLLDPDREGAERTLDVHISRIRKKLGNARWIVTVWGIGYRLDPVGS
ncbi:MAG: response regulator transcription factor [Polyangiaceae bacterium]|jgi:two-component system response regulator MtrA|nr:response regulator transcription factor [Polyangiaceae bacterium]